MIKQSFKLEMHKTIISTFNNIQEQINEFGSVDVVVDFTYFDDEDESIQYKLSFTIEDRPND